MTQKPALWRVAAYSPPGLPRPAISLITSLLYSLFQRLALYRQATLVRYGVIAAHRITHTVFAAASLSQTKVAWLYRFAPAVLLIQKAPASHLYAAADVSFPSLVALSAPASSVAEGTVADRITGFS